MAKRANNFRDITGLKFGRLLVSSLKEIKNKEIIWNCICDCGIICTKRGSNLKQGGSTSCGCYKKEIQRKEKGESGFNRLFQEYITGAQKRKLSFSLTIEEFKKLTKQNCHYCKIEAKQEKTTNNHRSLESGKEYSKYIYNGIDRKDNNLGYDLINCLTCCFLCNRSKGSMSYQAFMDYLDRFKK